MELRNLNTFVRAADAGSFSRAAAQLGYTQSTVTSQIQGLEEELGVPLFDRLPRGIALTRAGEVFLEHARELLLGAENARIAVKEQSEPSGRLRIGAFSSLCTAFLPELLKEYHKRYPDVDLVVRNGGAEDLEEMLGANRLDFAWMIAEQKRRFAWKCACEAFHPIWAVAAPGRFEPNVGKNLESAWSGLPFLLTEPGCPYRQRFEQFCAGADISPHVLLEADGVEGIISFARSGLGVGILPDFAAAELVQSGELLRLPIEGFEPQVRSALLYHPVKWVTPAMEAFLELAGEKVKNMHKNSGRSVGKT